MKLTGRRKSQNVEDRRGSTSGGGGGIDLGDILGQLGKMSPQSGSGSGSTGGGLPGGLGGLPSLSGCFSSKKGLMLILVIALVFVLLLMCNGGGESGGMLESCAEGGPLGGITERQQGTEQTNDGTYKSNKKIGNKSEDEILDWVSQILASTEDVWEKEFKKMGLQYKPVKLVTYNGSIRTGCGQGTAQMGPFYCSADQRIYIDLSFFETMRHDLGAIEGKSGDFSEGDFACAYVIAHEVGHHVQNLLGTLGKAHSQMAQVSQAQANKISVKIELQADFLAGLWGHDENMMFGSLDEGDLEEALRSAIKIGDDYLQSRAGYNNPQGYTHGTSKQRERWFKRGFTSGDINQGNTFALSDNQL